MKHVFRAAAVVLAAVVALAAASSKPSGGKPHRIVFELTNAAPEAWGGVLNNIENVRRAFGEQHTEIEVVVHGKGLGFLKQTNEVLRPRMEALAHAGVVFAACENTMRRQNVARADLLPFASTVDSGVAEIVRKQEAGWAYLRITE